MLHRETSRRRGSSQRPEVTCINRLISSGWSRSSTPMQDVVMFGTRVAKGISEAAIPTARRHSLWFTSPCQNMLSFSHA